MIDGKRLKQVLAGALGTLAVAVAGAWYVGHDSGSAARAEAATKTTRRPSQDDAEKTPHKRPAKPKGEAKAKNRSTRGERNARDHQDKGRRRKNKDAKPTRKAKVTPNV